MLIRRSSRADCKSSEITPEAVYRERRRFMAASGVLLAGSLLPDWLLAGTARYGQVPEAAAPDWFARQLQGVRWQDAPQDEALTPWSAATDYNNFYEFGPDKGDPAANAGRMSTADWTVQVDGEVARPGRYGLEELFSEQTLEERIYRLRCVEAWSMVIPWLGFPLAALLKKVEPTANARYVRFESLVDERVMPGVTSNFARIDWPYVEGLRLDEAMHPLTILAVGMYGRILPNQNGAPLRLMVPWKYGFKSIKSIVRISLVAEQPVTTWQSMAPQEYGFYANVNPQVDHPRWSQARERRLPSSLFSPNIRPTLMFNGYAEEVAGLYAGMDLHREY